MSIQPVLRTAAALAAPSIEQFQKHIPLDWIREVLDAAGVATIRKRRFPAEMVVWLIIGMGLFRDRKISELVEKLDLVLPDADGRTKHAPSGITQARSRLGDAAMGDLFDVTSHRWADRSATEHQWHGMTLYGIDGTTLRVPDSDENRAAFGSQDGGPRGPAGYPMVRLAVLLALRSHIIMGAKFGPYDNGEMVYATDLIDEIPANSLTIVDRGFLSAAFLHRLSTEKKDRHWMTRSKSTTSLRKVKSLGRGDAIVEWKTSHYAKKACANLPDTIRMRATTFQRKGFRPITILSSLLDEKVFPADEIRPLYHERWEIEMAYDELKTELLQREETIRSKTVENVIQEIYGILIGYNVVRVEMERIATECGVTPTRISFVAAMHFIQDELSWMACTSPGAIPARWRKFRDRAHQFVLPARRPARRYPRAVKIKMSSYNRKRPVTTENCAI